MLKLLTSFSGRHLLLIIILLGVGARIGAALYQGNSATSLPGVFDQISYHQLAVRVLEGHGFSFETGWWPATPANQPTAHWSYLYTLFLSATYFVFGINPLMARVIQSILTGLLQPLLAWRIGGRLFGPRVGLASAALTAFYGYFVYYSSSLVTEGFYFLAILWILDISIALGTSSNHLDGRGIKDLRPWVLLGVAAAVAVLLRQVFLPLIPLTLAWICWQSIRRHRLETGSHKALIFPLLHRVALVFMILVASILPCTIRNYRAFGEFVPVNTNAGFAFFWGNHPSHGTHFVPILPGDGSLYGVLIPEELLTLNEAQMDRALLQRGIAFVWEDPTRYALLSISRIREYFKFWPSQDSGALSNLVRVLSYGLCFPFLLSGVLMTFFPARRGEENVKPATMLLLGLAGTYCLIHLLTWTLVRYRLPVDAILMPFAALSLVSAFDWVSRSVRPAPVPLHLSAD